jgi:aspartokinase
MIAVPEVLKKILKNSPFVEEGLSSGIINLSAYARRIRPRVERELMKPVKEGAIIMGLRRLSKGIKRDSSRIAKLFQNMGDLTVRSNLVELTFLNSPFILEKQKIFLQRISKKKGTFVTFTQGVFEIAVIVSSSVKSDVEEIFKKEKLLSKFDNLSAIIIKLPPEAVATPGVHYTILKQLAWENINIVEVVSTFTEFTIILEKTQVDRAFYILKNILWQ